jgi:hypothetical protein
MAKKKGSPWTIIIVALLTFIAGIVFMAWYGEKLLPPPVPKKAAVRELKLFFSDVEGKSLEAERRRIKKGPARGLEAKVKEVVEALIEGPESTIYSIVNTVALNFPEIEAVQILVDGGKRDTLAGHIRIDFPLVPNKNIIKGKG